MLFSGPMTALPWAVSGSWSRTCQTFHGCVWAMVLGSAPLLGSANEALWQCSAEAATNRPLGSCGRLQKISRKDVWCRSQEGRVVELPLLSIHEHCSHCKALRNAQVLPTVHLFTKYSFILTEG